MTGTHSGTTGPDEPARYEIRLKGRIDAQWGDWFEGLTSATEGNGTTVLSGLLVDQAALHGVLRKVGDLGMTLVSINVVEAGDEAKLP
jgi:hypothetical protein